MPCLDLPVIEVDQLPSTLRNNGCFGSTDHELDDTFPLLSDSASAPLTQSLDQQQVPSYN